VVKFWDTSAIVPLFTAEPQSAMVRTWLRTDPGVTVWALSRIELLSAFARRARLEPAMVKKIREQRRLALRAYELWSEVTALENVRTHAEKIVEIHPLKAADAMQLGAAIVAAEEKPETLNFVTLDARLAEAAEKEGFRVLGPS
jgi:uncharacterized protein